MDLAGKTICAIRDYMGCISVTLRAIRWPVSLGSSNHRWLSRAQSATMIDGKVGPETGETPVGTTILAIPESGKRYPRPNAVAVLLPHHPVALDEPLVPVPHGRWGCRGIGLRCSGGCFYKSYFAPVAFALMLRT